MKKFLISIDTEGDNLWSWKPGDPIRTDNARYLHRFQSLCDKYNFKPTYLTNYEMAMDDRFADFARETLQNNRCEIGMHLHAWNNPPIIPLAVRNDVEPGAPYLIEYPIEVMEEKIKFITETLTERFNKKPVTHRAGRWAMNSDYYKLLNKYSYKFDCSVTPGKNWSNAYGQSPDSKGTDYSKYPLRPYHVENTDILEIPVTVRENHRLKNCNGQGLRKTLRNHYRAIKGQGKIWLRPDGRNFDDLIYLSDLIRKSNDDYLMFMLHSSEFMPGGSGRFDTEEKIDALYYDLERLFNHIAIDYEGMTIGEYGMMKESLRCNE